MIVFYKYNVKICKNYEQLIISYLIVIQTFANISRHSRKEQRAQFAKWRRDDAAIDRDGDAERRRPQRRRMRLLVDEFKEKAHRAFAVLGQNIVFFLFTLIASIT